MSPFVNEYFERESNPMLQPQYLCLSRSFLVSFTDPDKQFFNLKSVFNFLTYIDYIEIYRFITFLGIEILFIKKCPLKFMSGNT